jgi:hypothetical protein
MQEHSNSIKRPNLRIMGIKEGEEVPGKGIGNIINKTIAYNPQILRKSCLFRYRKPPGHQAALTKIEPLHGLLLLKLLTENTERMLKVVRERKKITHKGKPMKIIADFST